MNQDGTSVVDEYHFLSLYISVTRYTTPHWVFILSANITVFQLSLLDDRILSYAGGGKDSTKRVVSRTTNHRPLIHREAEPKPSIDPKATRVPLIFYYERIVGNEMILT